MNDKINKSSLEEAKANFEEIQKFALEQATENLKENVSKKVIEIMNSSLEGNVVQEEVIIHADDTTIVIDDNGNVDVDTAESLEGGEMDIETAVEPIEMEDSEEIEISDDEDEIEIDNSETEMNLDETNFEEQEAAMAAPAEMAPEAPVEEMPAEMPVEMPAEESAMANPFEEIGSKLDTLISLMGGEAGAGEDIEIVDDAGMAPEAAPVAAAPVAEEITFEVVNSEMEIPEMAVEDDILEVVEEEETVDEVKMHGVGHSVQRSTGTSAGPEVAKQNRERMAMKENKENKAQNEAKLAELIKENGSLKADLDKFEKGFIKLQENFGKMEDYNAKLVMAYKVAMSGGLTTDEKIQISEQFDKCESVKDAEILYKSIVNEHKIKVNKNPEKALKINTVKTVQAKSVSQPLYESKEVSRMKQLAGIKNLNE